MSNETRTNVNEQVKGQVVETTAETVSTKQIDNDPIPEVVNAPKKNWVAKCGDWLSKKASTPGGEVAVKVVTGIGVAVGIGLAVTAVKAIKGGLAKDRVDTEHFLREHSIPTSDTGFAVSYEDTGFKMPDVANTVADAVSDAVNNVVENVTNSVSKTD